MTTSSRPPSFAPSPVEAYQKLRPWTRLDSCSCEAVQSLLLVDLLTDNPIHCGACRCEVDPERLALTVTETEAVARWFSVASALYRLWLDSGAYEAFAKTQLLDPRGTVNLDGLDVARSLSARLPTRLWFFSDTADGEPTHCPVCGHVLDTNVRWGTGQCPRCPILV
jgi:hypothetical protein